MRSKVSFEVPDETTLTAFFESPPIEAIPSDGFWCYEAQDREGRTLRLSFNVIARFLQTSILLQGDELITVSHEGAVRLEVITWYGQEILQAECSSTQSTTKVQIHLSPKILVRWGTLVEPE